jgi:RNA polymerase sigma-B factor
MTQTALRAPPHVSRPAGRRPSPEYAHLSPLFYELARLPAGHRRGTPLRDRLIAGYLPLAQHIARRYVHRGEPLQDLEQVATIGLIHAVDRFDPSRGPDFLTFAVPTISGEVKRWFRDRGWAMRVPRRLKELDAAIFGVTGRLSQELGRAPRPSEIAARLDVPVADVVNGLQVREAYQCLSLDEPSGVDPVEDRAPAGGEALGCLDEGVALVEDRETLLPLLESLGERERRIVLLRFFGEMTQTQIAREVGVSQMHVSRLLAATLKKLRHAMTTDI